MDPREDEGTGVRARRAASLLLAVTLAGCAASPSVELLPLQPELAATGAIPFRLTDSVIALGVPASTDAAVTTAGASLQPPLSLDEQTLECRFGLAGLAPPVCGSRVVPLVAPVEFADATYAVQPKARRFVETRLAASYVPNSLRLAELAVAVKDHRVEVINAIGTLAAAAAGAPVASDQRGGDDADDTEKPKPPPEQMAKLVLPVIIEAEDLRDPAPTGSCPPAAGACHVLPRNPAWSYRLVRADRPDAQGLLPRARLPGLRDAMVASACRPARLDIYATLPNGVVAPVFSFRLSLADPDWLVAMPLPPKGQLAFHPLCGMDMKREEATEVGADAMATALYNQVQTLRSGNR